MKRLVFCEVTTSCWEIQSIKIQKPCLSKFNIFTLEVFLNQFLEAEFEMMYLTNHSHWDDLIRYSSFRLKILLKGNLCQLFCMMNTKKQSFSWWILGIILYFNLKIWACLITILLVLVTTKWKTLCSRFILSLLSSLFLDVYDIILAGNNGFSRIYTNKGILNSFYD